MDKNRAGTIALLIIGILTFLYSCTITDVSSNDVDANQHQQENPSSEDNQKDDQQTNQSSDPELEELLEVATQSTYTKEADGAPARPTWVDSYRHYSEEAFFKKGRYLLVWRKDPGDTGNYADRWELHQILFKNPTAMNSQEKWGKPIDAEDIEETIILLAENDLADHSYGTETNVTLPADLLLPDQYSPDTSTNYPPLQVPVAANTQVGYKAITTADNSRQLVVAYKVRAYRSVIDTDDKGKEITNELYNDSTVVMVNYKEGKNVQITGSSTDPGDGKGTSSDWVADTITSMSQLRDVLGFSSNQNFSQSWEDRKIPSTNLAPVEELITKEDFDTLFPPDVRKQYHDKSNVYYTWENFVEASRYFPKLFNEGSDEDRYRELAAFLGNKSHETGDGWVALGEDRWTYGMVWIVELVALTSSGIASNPEDINDLYKAYVRSAYYSTTSEHVGPPGKSYHGRGPVQLSWNYNYGAVSKALFEDNSILLNNPNLVAREGVIGFASAFWFWMQPQGDKPSAHDVMVGNVDLSEPYTAPTSRESRTARTHTIHSHGHMADGTVVSYEKYSVPAGVEVGFGLTINIINGGLESNTGSIDSRHAKRIGYYARYLDYFGTVKDGRSDSANLPISPEVSSRNENGARIGGDPVPESVVEEMKNWRTWIYLPWDGDSPDGKNEFPSDLIPSILSSIWQSSF